MQSSIIILTKHKEEIEKWIVNHQIKPLCKISNDGYTRLEILKTDIYILYLCHFIQNILLLKNPIIKEAKVVKEHILSSIISPMHTNILSELTEFFKENNIINIDGYITFRMQKYNLLIYRRLYGIMKKALLT